MCQCNPNIDSEYCSKLNPEIKRYADPDDEDEAGMENGLVDPAMDTCKECGRCLYAVRGTLKCQGCMEDEAECECEPLEEQAAR